MCRRGAAWFSRFGRDVGSNNGACGLHTGEGPGQAHRDQFERQGAAGSDRQAAKRCRRTDSKQSGVVSAMKMKRNHMFMMAGALALAVGVAGTAMAQSSAVAQAMAAGTVGEQAAGYLGVKGSVAAAVKAAVDSINTKRRASSTIGRASCGAKGLQ